MNNIIAERIKNVSLTKTQIKIADYFIRNPEKVGICSSMEVAQEIGVSDVSITRFARAIGYSGFTDLKNDIYNSLASRATGGVNSLSMSDRFDFNRARFHGRASGADFIKVSQYNIDKTFQQNNADQFENVASMLIDAKHRYIIGFRGCKGVVTQCVWLLRFIIDHVIPIADEASGGVGALQDIEKDDCALFFSVSRYYKSDIRLAELVKKRGGKFCLVTDSMLSPLVSLADEVILVETRHMSFFNTMLPLHMVVEYLITIIAQKEEDGYKEKADERDRLTEELRIE